MTRSKYDMDVSATLDRVHVENLDVLRNLLQAFEEKWKDELVTLVTPEKVMRHQGRVLAMRDILDRMDRAVR